MLGHISVNGFYKIILLMVSLNCEWWMVVISKISSPCIVQVTKAEKNCEIFK